MRASAALMATLGVGCFLPVATGTPQAATTAGRGKMSLNVAGELPTVDLIASDADGDSQDVAPVAAGVITAGYGLTDHTDLEVGAEAAMYFFLMPLPTGGSVGLRHHLLATDGLDVGIAARVGGVAVGTSSEENPDGDDASAVYGAINVTTQGAYGMFRPLVSAQLMPTTIRRDLGDDRDGRYQGLVSSATVGLMLQLGSWQVGPYLTGTWFRSDAVDRATLLSGGVSFGLHPDRRAKPPVAPPAVAPLPVAPPVAPAPIAPPPR